MATLSNPADDIYDLSRIICFIEPDSKHTEWAFELPHNKTHLAPRQRGVSSDLIAESPASDEREATPNVDSPSRHRTLSPLLALTTEPERLFDPAEGHVLGSDSESCDILLDDTNSRGVSSKHVRLFIDPDEDEDINSLTLQNLSGNSVRAISHEMRINDQLTRKKSILLNGGTWTIILHTKVDIVFKVVFPERGKRYSDYINNWSAFRAANENALPRLRITLGHSAQETPLIKAPTYVIDWSENAVLGKGTFGVVRKASSVATSEVFAAKIFKVRGDIQKELGFLQALRYVRVNVQTLSSLLSHHKKHIVTYNAFIQHNGNDVLIMELLGGGTLEDKMRQEDPNNPLPRAKLYWVQLASALRYLHGKRVLHRDIKPANILFNSADDLKLCDFGISKKLRASEDSTHSQTGSPHYAAPEIFDGQPYTFPADIWSLGITVLEIYRRLPPKLESWRIAGSDDSAWNRWLSAITASTHDLPRNLNLLKEQLATDPASRPTAANLATGLREPSSVPVEPNSSAVVRLTNMKRRSSEQFPDNLKDGRDEAR